MKNLLNPSSYSRTGLTTHFPVSSTTSFNLFNTPSTSSTCRSFVLKCSSGDTGHGSLKNALSGMVDKRVEELLKKDENRDLFEGLEKASLRVEMAKKELAEIKRQEIEAVQMKKYVDYLETRKSEIEESQKEMSEARAMMEEAERSLSSNLDDMASEDDKVNKDEERLESIKAGSIAAIVGTLAELPISFSQVSNLEELILPSVVTFISCALFGVTFRYAVRRDLDDIHLKTGTAAAFGFVKGLGALGAGSPLELNSASLFSHAVDGAVYVSENFFVFVFAAVGLDFCFKMRLLSPFPMKIPVSPKR